MIRKRVISILMSTAMLCTNIIPAMQVMASETPAAEEVQTETEKTKLFVTLEKVNGLTYGYEDSHYETTDGKGNTILAYYEDDKVKLNLTVADDHLLERIQSITSDGKDIPMEWTAENKIRFTMPGKDVHVEAVTIIRPAEAEDLAENTTAAEEAAPDDAKPSQESAEHEPETVQEMENGEPDQKDEAEKEADTEGSATSEDVPNAAAVPENMSDTEPSVDDTEMTAETNDVAVQDPDAAPADEKRADEEPQMDDTLQKEDPHKEENSSETLQDSQDEDGFPVQGSVIMLPGIEISIGTTLIEPESSFAEVTYPQDTVSVNRLSDEIIYGVPGTYDLLYRADESRTGKFWYLVRPVTVKEPGNVPDEPEEGQESETGSDDEEAAEETDDPPSVTEEVTDETETEQTANEEQEEMQETSDVSESVEEKAMDPQSIYFDTTEGYSISLENDRLTYQPGEDVSFTVTAAEDYAIKTAAAYVAITEDEAGSENRTEDKSDEPAPILITEEKVAVTQTSSVNSGDKVVEATYEFEMPEESVVLSAKVMLAAASNDVTVELTNGGIKSIPKAWTPDGMTWISGSTVIGYTRYRKVTMPDGKSRSAYCLQPALGAEEDGKYTATEIRKKGKISAAEATTLRKAVFYCYGGPGWETGEIKDILSDCSTTDEYYVATHYILAKIYCDATSGDWNVATSGGIDYPAVNARGKAKIEAAVAKIKSLPDPDAYLSPTQVAGVYNETTGFAHTQQVKYTSTVPGNTLTITLPANVYLDIAGGSSYSPGQKAKIAPGSTFTLKKKGYDAAHKETLTCKAAVFTDFDAYLINVSASKQNMGFSYVADKDFELSVTWPDQMTHLNIIKIDDHTGESSATPGYNIDGAVYGIYADAEKTKLLEELKITDGKAVSSDNYVIGKTYYVAEISAPEEYEIDTNVYPVMAAAGGTATVTSSEVPRTIRISVQKVDAETGEAKPQTSTLSFEGALFGIYSDEGCTEKAVDINGETVADIRTDANGHAQTPQTLLIGDYYVKELAAPEGYLMNETVFTVTAEQVRDEIVSQDADVQLTCAEQIIRANMDLIKLKTLKGPRTETAQGVEFYFTYVNDPAVTFTVVPGKENTLITDEDGYATTKSDQYPRGTLIYGEWQITEGNTPEGFEPIDPTTFVVNGDGRTYRFTANNRQIQAAVLIEKHDANTGSLIPVEGVRFRIYKDGEVVRLFNADARSYEDTWITDKDGMVQLPEMLEYGVYTVVEDPESIPDGYLVMDNAPLVVNEMRDEFQHPITLTAMEPPQLGNITVEKRDAKTDEALEGFSFDIIAAEDITDPVGVIRTGTNAEGEEVSLTAGTVVEHLTTGKNGSAASKDLFLGRYTVRESKASNGYAITKETQDVTLNGDPSKARDHENASEYVLFRNEPTTVRIWKVSARTGDPLEGITFLVHKLAGDEAVSDYVYTGEEETPDGVIDAMNNAASDEGEDTEETSEEPSYPENVQSSGLDEDQLSEDELFVTGKNGEILVDHLDADSTYVVREIRTIPGYNLSHELVSFSVDSDGLIDGNFVKEVTMSNEPNMIHISKQDITNCEEIPGARLTITDSEGNIVEEWTSTYEVHEIPALAAGSYTLTEVTAPDGYEETESITFNVINSRKIQSVVMKDSPFREVEVSKTDITGDKEIIGAILSITDTEGNEIETWESTAEVHTVKLHSGEYILTERKPADGYVTAESIPFTVIRTSAADYDIQGVAMKDDVTKTKITKSDITDGKPVIGAELIISDTDGTELYRWTTTKDPYYIEMLPIGTYTLTEITAPSGYATAESVTFTVEDTGEIQKVDMKDTPLSAEISKKDIADGPGGRELPGAHLTVKNESGEVIDDWVSTKEPHMISMLPVGKYTLTEVTAPEGYELAETITFEITDSGEVHKVVMYDSPKEETVDLTGKIKKTTIRRTYTPGGGTSIVAPVKTGDETPILLFLAIASASLFTVGGAFIIRRKKIFLK